MHETNDIGLRRYVMNEKQKRHFHLNDEQDLNLLYPYTTACYVASQTDTIASQGNNRQNTYHRASRHELLWLLLEASATSATPSPVLALAPKHGLQAASPPATLLPWFSFSFPFVGCYCNKIMLHKLCPPPILSFSFPFALV